MRIPLPGGPRLALGRCHNPGLLFQRFFSEWTGNWDIKDQGKSRWLSRFEEVWGDRELLEERVFRLVDLMESCGGHWTVVQTTSRFVTGLGIHHPVENGFRWHYELGVPYLPGSSLKGVLAPALRKLLPTASGSGGASGSTGVDSFIVFPMLPVNPVKLEVDVLTPHYAGWDPTKPPGDWMDPKPITFLTVAEGQRFLLAVAPRVPSELEMDDVISTITETLAEEGLGAKADVGYGRFKVDDEGTKRLREELAGRPEVLASLSPRERYGRELEGMDEKEAYDWAKTVSGHQEDGPKDPRAAAQALQDLGYIEAWNQGKAKTPTEPGSTTPALKVGKKKLKGLAAELKGLLEQDDDAGAPPTH